MGREKVSLALMFDQIETSGIWPLQLCAGFVSSLEKEQGNLDVDAFRPGTVYSLVTRLWSSVRSRLALADLAATLPGGIRSSVRGREASLTFLNMCTCIGFLSMV